MREEFLKRFLSRLHSVSYYLYMDPMLAFNKSLARGHHIWQCKARFIPELRTPLSTYGSKILRQRFPPPGVPVLYRSPTLAVPGTCEYDRIFISLIRLCSMANSDGLISPVTMLFYMRLCYRRLERYQKYERDSAPGRF